MKNIVIFTMGTRGDIQPYIYLAQALMEAGYHIVIGTHPCWNQIVAEAQVEFVPIGPDIDIEYEAAVIRGKTKNPAISMLKTMNFVFKIIEGATGDIYKACKGMDLVIVSHSQMGATEAEALGIPTVNVTLQVEMIPEKKRKQTIRDRIFAAFVNPQMVRPYNKIRKKYQLSPVRSMDEVMSPKLNLIPVSKYITEQNPFWEEQNKVVGYWYREEPDYHPPEELGSFLKAGERPVILALGAMSFESGQEREKLDMFVSACKRTGMRVVIQGFHKTLADYQLPETMISIGSVPHCWLFRQGYAVIHHCGFGTSASAMLFGIPSIPVPHVLDQFAFANRLYQVGVSVEPIKAGNLTEDKIVCAITELKNNYGKIKRIVEETAEKMQAEKGLEKSVELIERAMDWGQAYLKS